MWEEGTCIYGTPGVHNNFPPLRHFLSSPKAEPDNPMLIKFAFGSMETCLTKDST